MSEEQQPVVGIAKIYLKDLSLEVPNAPRIFLEPESPQVDINMHNEIHPLDESGLFEVVLTVTVTATLKERTVFLVEAAQAGIFQIQNLPDAQRDAALGTFCPSTLLPYAREAIAGTVTRAGFPPVVLQHMDFAAIYEQHRQQAQQPAPVAAH